MSDAFRILLGVVDLTNLVADDFEQTFELAGLLVLVGAVAVRWTTRRRREATPRPVGAVGPAGPVESAGA